MLSSRGARGLLFPAARLTMARMKTLFDSPTHDVHLIQAPGTVGELRLVAREIRTRLAQGTKPGAIVVTARHPAKLRTVVREVFAEYEVLLDDPTPAVLARHPAVGFLLAAWQIPDDGFAFSPLTAVLRSGWFKPKWPAVTADPDLPLRAETLLRGLGVPRDRTAYLAAVAEWAKAAPFPLEDEVAEERGWKKRHELAQRCQPFLDRFFTLWNTIPNRATLAAFVARFTQFADACGVPSDDPGWFHFHEALVNAADGTTVTRAEFATWLSTRAERTPGPPEPKPRGPAVRFLAPEEARDAACEHLFLIGLSEGSFPDPDEVLAEERTLFAELTARPTLGLHLSYPAVDAKGEELLPATLLQSVLANVTRTTRQAMPIEGYTTRPPISPAEVRVQAAIALAHDEIVPPGHVPEAVFANLMAARAAATARFKTKDYGPYDGRLTHPAALAEVAKRFQPTSRISPTTLETYVACPFRFLLERLLRLEPHEDPVEEIEHTRRGSAVHRALSRLHRTPVAQADLEGELKRHLADVVIESMERSAGPVERKLWELEGRRLARIAKQYPQQTDKFRAKWDKEGVVPAPHAVEPSIGVTPEKDAFPWPDLVIERDGISVHIGGRIDRIDSVQLDGEVGFWIIDYKTGKAGNYTGKDVETLKKLQLPLYALAVERVMFAGQQARPLGVAYWLVTDTGPKVALPNYRRPTAWYADRTEWETFRDVLETWVVTIVQRIRAGDFALAPRSEKCTDTCPYGPTCRIGTSRHAGKSFGLPLPVIEDE